MTVDELVEMAHSLASAVLIGKPGAQAPTIFFVQFAHRDPAMMQMPWSTDREVSASIAAMRKAFEIFGDEVVSYAFMSEAWSAEYDWNNNNRVQPKDREDRIEVVFANAFDRRGGHAVRAWTIVRGADGVVTRLAARDEDETVWRGGRLHNLFAPTDDR